MMNKGFLVKLLAVLAVILCGIALLASVVNGFSVASWTLPAGCLSASLALLLAVL